MRLNFKNSKFIIYHAFKAGFSMKNIADKFHYCKTSIWNVVHMYNPDEHNTDIPEINIIGKSLGLRESEIERIQTILHRYGYSGRDDGWKDLLPEDLYEIPNFDPWYVDIIWLAQHIDP